MTQAAKAQVDEVLYIPAALALHQRPGVAGIPQHFRNGYGASEQPAFDVFVFSSHCCPNGHYLKPSLAVAAGRELVLS